MGNAQDRQAVMRAEFQALLDEVRRVYLGKLVCIQREWCGVLGGKVGVVERVDDDGRAAVVYASDTDDQPVYGYVGINLFGTAVVPRGGSA